MKNLISFIMLLFMFVSAFASNPKKSRTRYYRHEVNVSIGGIDPSTSGSDSYENKLMRRFGLVSVGCSFGDGLAAGCHSSNEPNLDMVSSTFSPITLGYYYHLNRRLAVGIFFIHVKVEDELGWEEPYIFNVDGYELSKTGFSYIKGSSSFLMPSVKWSWLNNRWCSLYSKISLGLNYQSLRFESEVIPQKMFEDYSKSNHWGVSYMLTPIGWEIGKQKIRWFIEFSFGSNVNSQIGLTYRFARF